MPETSVKEKFKCKVCNLEFDIPVALAGHMRSHSVEEVNKANQAPTPSLPENKPIEMVEIMIHHQDGESEYVPVNILGRDVKINPHWLFQRGQWVKVPRLVLEVLNQAVIETSEYTPKTGGVSDDNTPNHFNIRDVSYARYAVSSRPV